ncbi:MAG: hypothetical protein IM638_09045 [Bacteroidetes bacterium]|nr:hypothetical protein [Bacteroidota bacterium]
MIGSNPHLNLSDTLLIFAAALALRMKKQPPAFTLSSANQPKNNRQPTDCALIPEIQFAR